MNSRKLCSNVYMVYSQQWLWLHNSSCHKHGRFFSTVCTNPLPVRASSSFASIGEFSSNSEKFFHSKLPRYTADTMGSSSKVFNINDYDIIGFDLDNTLLRYNLPETVPMQFHVLAKSMVRRGYSEKFLLKPMQHDVDYLQKGLIIDSVKGNVLKLDSQGNIIRASHGSKFLTEEEIVQAYPEKRWSITSQFVADPLSTWNGPASEQMRTLLDSFDMPASLVMARAVDAINANGDEGRKDYNVYPDILCGLIEMYSREKFADGTSEYFEELKKNTEKYVLKTSPKVIEWLKRLKQSNKAIFLLTGSNIDLANLTASHALGENWRELFDNVICFSRKPGFFTENRPFLSVKDLAEESEIPHDEPLELNRVYSQGNWKQLNEVLARKSGKSAEECKCLYVGDNLIQDIHTPSVHSNFDTVAISEEMIGEGFELNGSGIDVPSEFKDFVASSGWGSYFSHEGSPTLWTDIITHRSKICVPTVDYLVEDRQDFYCENAVGFYPVPPKTYEE